MAPSHSSLSRLCLARHRRDTRGRKLSVGFLFAATSKHVSQTISLALQAAGGYILIPEHASPSAPESMKAALLARLQRNTGQNLAYSCVDWSISQTGVKRCPEWICADLTGVQKCFGKGVCMVLEAGTFRKFSKGGVVCCVSWVVRR